MRRRFAVVAALFSVSCASAPPPAPSPPPAPAASPPPFRPDAATCEHSRWYLEAEAIAAEDPALATQLLDLCLRKTEGPASAWRLLSSLQEDSGQIEQARRTLLRAVASHPADAFAWAALARIEATRGNGAMALGAFERAHRLRPNSEMLRGEWERAVSRYGSGYARARIKLLPLLSEAEGRLELDDAPGALAVLEIAELAAQADPALEARVQLLKALIYLSQGKLRTTVEAVERGLAALKQGPPERRLEADLLVVLAEVHLSQNRASQAASAARSARKAVPKHALAAVNLGVALLRLGDLESAAQAFEEALDAGLAQRIDRAAFLAIDGVSQLVEKHPDLQSRIHTAWSKTSSPGSP